MGNSFRNQEQGVVLIVSLLILLLLAIIAMVVSETNILQLRMAGNQETKTAAVQRSLAMVDSILANANNTPVVGGVGYKICAASVTGGDCDVSRITLDTGVAPAEAHDYFATRVGPLETTIPVMSEDMASSGTAYRAAKFEVTAEYDGRAQELGRARIVQGVLLRIGASSQ